jgi:hypothetical protein
MSKQWQRISWPLQCRNTSIGTTRALLLLLLLLLLSAVIHYHKVYLWKTLDASHPMLQAMRKGLERAEAAAGMNVAMPRQPLTWQQLHRGMSAVNWAEYAGGGVVWYGLALSYLLLARASELFAYDGTSRVNEAYCLRRADLVFMKDGQQIEWSSRKSADAVMVTFRASKSDQQRRGATLERGEVALELINSMLDVHPELPMQSPLLAYMSGNSVRTVTRAIATKALLKMLAEIGVKDTERYALHSGRIGAATQLAANGHSDSAIMAAGRWKSTSIMV